MELPQDVLLLIKEYSMPQTRPDWRTLHIMTNLHFYSQLTQLRDYWYSQDTFSLRRKRNYQALKCDRLVRCYILRYKLCYLADI